MAVDQAEPVQGQRPKKERDSESKEWGREDKEGVTQAAKGEMVTLTAGDETTHLKRPLPPNVRRYASPLKNGMCKQLNECNAGKWRKQKSN